MKLIHCQEFHYMLNKHDHQHDSKGSDFIRKELRNIFLFHFKMLMRSKHAFVLSYPRAYLKSTEQKCSLKIIVDIRFKKKTLDILLLLFLFIQKHLKYNYAHPMS